MMAVEQLLLHLKRNGIRVTLKQGKLQIHAGKGQFTEELKLQLKENKEGIIAYLSKNNSDNKRPITTRQILDETPLSFAQQRLWFIDQLQGGTPEYNMPMVFDVQGPLNLSLVTDVFSQIIARHEVLRTVYVETEGETKQVIRSLSDIDFAINEIDQRHLTRETQSEAVNAYVEGDILKPFNLAQDLMLRVSYIHTGDETGVLVFNMHHIATDGWSMEVLIKEFFALYEAFSQGKPNSLPELDIQYADYAHWQRNQLEGEVLDTQLDYWAKQLDEVPPIHSLPLSYPRPEVRKHVSAIVRSNLSADISQKLQAIAKQHQLTPFMLLHGALSLLLSRHSNSSDIVIGTPVANRKQEELAPLIGLFANTLVLRANTQHATLAEYFSHIRQVHLGAQSNQDVPFEQLVERLNIPRSTAHTPLFQIILTTNTNYRLNDDTNLDAMTLSGVTLSPYQSDRVQAKCDLDIDMSISDEGVGISWTYDVSLFDEANIQRLNDHLCRMLTALSEVTHGDVQPNRLAMLSAEEAEHLIYELNDTAMAYPKDQCIHESFEQQAMATPDKVALTFEGQHLTYQELNARANQLAHYLVETQGVKPDTLVGLCVERSLDMVIGTLAILKAGAAYVPLDPSYPQARLAYMIEDAELRSIVSHGQVIEALQDYSGNIIYLDEQGLYSSYSTDNLDKTSLCLSPSNLAYVIYTSGSTGNPKGVMIEHRAFVHFLQAMQPLCRVEANDVWLTVTSLSFDIAGLEIYLPLCSGAQVVIASSEDNKDPNKLLTLIEQNKVTHFQATPSTWKLLDDVPACTELAIKGLIGGEAAPVKLVQSLLSKGVELINVYGPTETTVWSTAYAIPELTTEKSVPLGKALANEAVYILDNNRELLPQGAIGELYIGGVGLARGYLNQPALTAERFINNPYYEKELSNSSERLYRTGDLVRYLADGSLEFVGRVDHQIKLRGFRIELSEVETQLSKQPEVDSALVMVKELAGSQQLVGYIKPTMTLDEAEHSSFLAGVKAGLSNQLPQHMVPGILMLVTDWPLTPNGKLDRKALPHPDGSTLQGEYIAPETDTEKALAKIWSEILNIEADKISTSANFFELGGHSLLVMKLIGQASNHGLHITAQDVFTESNLQGLASLHDTHFAQRSAAAYVVPDNLIAEDCQHITPEMLPLVSLTQDEITRIAQRVPKGMANIADIYPLGPLQAGILYTHIISGEQDLYVTPLLFKLNNKDVLDSFIQGMSFLVQRHDVLRTMVQHEGLSQPLQVVCKEVELPVKWLEFADDVDVKAAMTEKSLPEQQWLDLTQAPMFQLQVAQGNEGEYYLLLQIHHMIADRVSLEVIQYELGVFHAGQADSLAPVQPYRNFIAYTANQFEEQAAEAHFKATLGDVEEPTAPFGLLNAQSDGIDTCELIEQVPEGIAQQIQDLSRQLKLSPATIFHAAFSLVVAACSNKQDVVFGSVMSGRLQGLSGADSMLGVFMNTPPVRAQLSSKSVLDFVYDMHAYLHALIPFEQTPLTLVQNCSGLTDNATLFSALLNYRHAAVIDNIDAKAVDVEPETEVVAAHERSNYPFNLIVDDFGTGFGLHFQVDPSIDVGRTMAYMQTALAVLVDNLVTSPSTCVSALSVLPSEELKYLTQTLNDTAMDYAKAEFVHQLIDRQALENPDNVAVIFEGKELTYQALNSRANQLANYLIECDLESGARVGLLFERSFEQLIAMLAVLKAGVCYVPLDVSYPQSRIDFICEDADVELVLIDQGLVEEFPLTSLDTVVVEPSNEEDDWLSDYETSLIDAPLITSDTLAYVLYTSGSTGKPKGVKVTHGGLENYIQHTLLEYVNDEIAGAVVCTPLCFDATVTSIMSPLCCGKSVLLLANGDGMLPQLSDTLFASQSWIFKLTPAHLNAVEQQAEEEAVGTANHILVIGGEQLTVSTLSTWKRVRLPNASFVNEYGPTETVVGCTIYRVDSEEQVEALQQSYAVPIGRPIKNTQLLVLNEQLQVQPVGGVGELYIAGAGVALGYINREELTQKQFIKAETLPKEIQAVVSSQRLYKTGDQVRWLANGELEFIGRVDDQVKIRGYRIELGDVESQLTKQEGIDSALVIAKEIAGSQQLVGYINPKTELDESAQASFLSKVKAELLNQLPNYMVPNVLILVSEWPLTQNGKVDKKALPELDGSSLQEKYVKPETDTEEALVEIWSQLLEIDANKISTVANFFALGGHSLNMIRMFSIIKQQFGISMDILKLFESPNIKDIAEKIDSEVLRIKFGKVSDEVLEDEMELLI